MPRTCPWHSTASAVYHNNSDCEAARTGERGARREGTGGKPLCPHCAELARAQSAHEKRRDNVIAYTPACRDDGAVGRPPHARRRAAS